MKNAEELKAEFIKKYAPSILDKNSNTSFVLDLAVLLESFVSLREKEAFKAGFIAGGSGWRYGQHAEKEWETHFDKWHTKHKEQ